LAAPVNGQPGTEIRLSWAEMTEAAITGVLRNVCAIKNGQVNRHGLTHETSNWAIHINGALAERAAARALDVYDPGRGTGPDPRGDISTRPGLQVRHTLHDRGSLILHPTDADGDAFILVTGQAPCLNIRGWVFGFEGKRDAYWRGSIERPAYFVPIADLHDLAALKTARHQQNALPG
jgi:hypothetical protein